MTVLAELAEDLGTSERTLRRLVSTGFIRARRPSPRKVEVDLGERAYLRSHWELIVRLRAALRNEKGVRLALLFGSTARGSDLDGSDIDIAVVLESDDPLAHVRLQVRLRERLGRDTQVLRLDGIQQEGGLLRQIARDGRVIVDRDDLARQHTTVRKHR